MLTARLFLSALLAGTPLPGTHLLVTAHPDDETISASALLSGADVRILQLTDGVPVMAHDRADQLPQRRAERDAALVAGGWAPAVRDAGVPGRSSFLSLPMLLAMVQDACVGVDAVWTHPYEAGHLDHDTAAWLVQQACARPWEPLRMEFASYHQGAGRQQIFGAFWSAPTETIAVSLAGARLQRKQAALAAYASQAHILRKFRTPTIEPYRVAPVYDFRKPAPPVGNRWDAKGYRPSTAEWRRLIAEAGR